MEDIIAEIIDTELECITERIMDIAYNLIDIYYTDFRALGMTNSDVVVMVSDILNDKISKEWG